MHLHELRINNIVFIPATGQTVPVSAIDVRLQSIVVNMSLVPIHIKEVEPVRLTEKILLESLAEKKNDKCYKVDRFEFRWQSDYGYWYVSDFLSKTYLTKIEFVHEYQNFIFEMNREEVKLQMI